MILVYFRAPRWLKKNNQNGAQTHPKRFSLGDFCRSQRGASPAWNLELLITKPCFLIVKLSFRYYLIVRNPRGWSSGSKNIPKDLQLGKSWKSIWNLSFAWISLILKDFGEFWWNFMNFDGFWRYFDGFRADTDSRGAASSRKHVLASLAMPTQRLEGVANLKTSFLSSYRRISKFRRAGSSIRLLKPATTVTNQLTNGTCVFDLPTNVKSASRKNSFLTFSLTSFKCSLFCFGRSADTVQKVAVLLREALFTFVGKSKTDVPSVS